jgi:general secretion pathway protein A
MYQNLFGFFGLPENPFAVNPDPRYLFLTPCVQEALTAISYGIRNRKGLMLLTGEAGTGKTTLIRSVLNSLHEQETPAAFIFNSSLKVSDLYALIFAEFGIPCGSEAGSSALQRIYPWLIDRYQDGETPVLIVDEAQGLPKAVLEEIRLLLNFETPREKLLQLVLVAQPELEETLKRPELRQLRQRVSCHCKIAPLSLDQTQRYIGERLRIAGSKAGELFMPEAIHAVHHYSEGIPRVVNLLCEHALINACAGGVRPVPMHIIEEVATEFQLRGVEPFSPAYISYGCPSPILASELPTRFQTPIHSPADSDAIIKDPCPMAPLEGSSVVLSSSNVPEHEEALILPSESDREHATEAKESSRISSIMSTAQAETGPLPMASSVEVDSPQHDVSQLSTRHSVSAAGELAPDRSKPSVKEQFIPWIKRTPILPAFRSLSHRLPRWREQHLRFLSSIDWRRVTAFSLLWLREPIGTVHWCQVKPLRISDLSMRRRVAFLPTFRSQGHRLPKWWEQRSPFLSSTTWRRAAAFLLLWLREPIGTVHWCQVKPLQLPAAWTRKTQSLLRRLREPLH